MSQRLRSYPSLQVAKDKGAISFLWSRTSVIALDHNGIPLTLMLTQSEYDHAGWRSDCEHELAYEVGVVRPQGWQS